MKTTPRSPEQINAEMQVSKPLGMWFESVRSDWMLGMILRIHSHEIPPEHLRWLKGLLRAHLRHSEYRLLAERCGWMKRKVRSSAGAPQTGVADDPLHDAPEIKLTSDEFTDPEIPF